MKYRPASPPSRYGYSIKIDIESLPEGVTVREVGEVGNIRFFITNSSDIPLIINQRFDLIGRLACAEKLVSSKVYQYYPNGVCMEGLTHLKGWQDPFGEINSTLIYLEKVPQKIVAGRKPNLAKDCLPEPEPFAIPVNYDGQPYEIEGLIYYHWNDYYDEYYLKQDLERPMDNSNTISTGNSGC
jgi:hypothetical protein